MTVGALAHLSAVDSLGKASTIQLQALTLGAKAAKMIVLESGSLVAHHRGCNGATDFRMVSFMQKTAHFYLYFIISLNRI